jgi:chloramphenicol O-acetyltransferase type B
MFKLLKRKTRSFFIRLMQEDFKPLQERFPNHQFGRSTYDNSLRVHDWGADATLRIGAFCSLASEVQIFLGGNHRPDWVTTYPFNVVWPAGNHIKGSPSSKGDVIIGNDVWIGHGAVILSGVTIGDGAVIGARAVVAKDVPPYGIAAGNPARVVRMRFDDTTIERLLNIQWWSWEDARIERYLPLLLNQDIAAFLDAAEATQPTVGSLAPS